MSDHSNSFEPECNKKKTTTTYIDISQWVQLRKVKHLSNNNFIRFYV